MLKTGMTTVERMTQQKEDVDKILKSHHAALTCARTSAWAQGHGALLALPTFVPVKLLAPVAIDSPAPKNEKNEKATFEVFVISGPGHEFKQKGPETTAGTAPIDEEVVGSSSLSLGWALTYMWTSLGCCLLAFRWRRGRVRRARMSQAELAEDDFA